MTPEETLRAYSKAIEEGDTVMGEMLSVESRHIMMPLIWGFLRQEKAGITEEISNVEIWYSPDSSQCMIYYDIDEIDRKTGKVVRNKPDRQDHMIMINGRWKMGSGPDDKLLPKSLQDRWPEYEEEKAAALKEADEMMAKELEQ
ncbi:MAG TPA: hypothetical protein VEF04_22165 [Blastocatellia bacterium]|nr:hypothetical protein [Blastocatellia bacterium]